MTDSLKTPGSVVDLILRDHRLLRDEIAILKTEDGDEMSKRRSLVRFLRILRAHCVAEEGALFSVLEQLRTMRGLVIECYEEHDLAEVLQEQIELHLRNTPGWSETLNAKAKIMAEIVEHHLDDEEDEIFPVLGPVLELRSDEDMKARYARLRKSALDIHEPRGAHVPHGGLVL